MLPRPFTIRNKKIIDLNKVTFVEGPFKNNDYDKKYTVVLEGNIIIDVDDYWVKYQDFMNAWLGTTKIIYPE